MQQTPNAISQPLASTLTDAIRAGLRRAAPADAASVRSLTRAAYTKWVPVIGREPKPMTADYDVAVRDHLVDLLEVDGELASLIEMRAETDHLLIVNVAVSPSRQGQGYGRALLAHAEALARSLGLDELRLYTNGRFTENLRLYERVGYRVDREETSHLGIIVHMSKRLPGAADSQFPKEAVPMKTLNPPTVWTVPETFRTIYTHALEAAPGRTLFVSGQFGVAPDGQMQADFPGQLGQAMDNVEALLSAAGMALSHVAKATFFLTRAADLPALGQLRRARWASDTPAAVTVIVVAALARPDALVEVEVTAIEPVPHADMPTP